MIRMPRFVIPFGNPLPDATNSRDRLYRLAFGACMAASWLAGCNRPASAEALIGGAVDVMQTRALCWPPTDEA
jgi:hypothetical protein